MRDRVLDQCDELFRQAEAMMPTAPKVSTEQCRAFLRHAEAMVGTSEGAAGRPADVSVSLDGCRGLLRQAERLVPAAADLGDCEALLEKAGRYAVDRWATYMDRLQHADPRDEPDFETVNLLRVFGISRREAPHSRFLGWLLNPEETHGLGASFLGSFLLLAQKACRREFEAALEDVDVELERSSDRGVPDISIAGRNFMCVVENKIMAREGQDQTRRYADAAMEEAHERGIPAERLLLVFLSPEGREPEDPRFHALSYRPIIELLDSVPTDGVPHIVGAAIKQFVFNLRARVLDEYDRQFEILTHLKGYNGIGDEYVREHWRGISSLAQELREADKMVEFDGFSELSVLYAEKYDLVEAMEETFAREREQLFQELQNIVADKSWFDPERFVLYTKGRKFELRLRNPVSEGELARVGVRLSPSRLGRRELYSDIWLKAAPPEMKSLRERFKQAAGQQLIDTLDVADYQAAGRYLVRRQSVPIEIDTILETMVEEVEKLRQLLPYLEEAYLDVSEEAS